MKKYYLVVVGENVLIDRGMNEPLVGFVAPRKFLAKNEEEATRLLKINVLKEWKVSFNRDNKAGTPILRIAQVTRIKNPFKRFKFTDDFLLYRSNEERDILVERANKAFKSWFVVK